MIRGERTNLRAVERSDARFVCDLLNAPSVQAGWGTLGVPVSIHLVEQDIEGWLESERATRYPACLIVESLDRVPLGLTAVQLPGGLNGGGVSLSVAIDPLMLGQGFGRDALVSVAEALFDEWRMHRIELTREASNERAIAHYESLGVTREGTRDGATFAGGAWHDQHIIRLLAADQRPWLI